MESLKLMHNTFGRKIMAPCNALPAHLSSHINSLEYWKLSEMKFSFEWAHKHGKSWSLQRGQKRVQNVEIETTEVEGNAKWMMSAYFRENLRMH